MIAKRILATAAVGLFMLAGCDDKGKTASITPAHPEPSSPSLAVPLTTDPKSSIAISAPIPTTPPTTRPAEPPHSTFLIADGRNPQWLAFNFPRARLHIDREQKTAVLYSDDPKNAIDSNYAGNGYYMVIPLSDDALQHLEGYRWQFRAASSEHQDSADGIFLEGQRYHLQPSEMVVTFSGASPMVSVNLQGSFYQFDMTQNARDGTLVQVMSLNITATVDAPK